MSRCTLFAHAVSHPEAAPRTCWVQEEVLIIRTGWKTVLHMARSVEGRKLFPTKFPPNYGGNFGESEQHLDLLTIGLSCVQELWFFLMSKHKLGQHNDGSAPELS